MMAAAMVLELPPEVARAEIVMLGEAQLCEDCTAISPAPEGVCLKCGSRALMALAAVVNREGGAQ
jgi:rRNA maturation endonuclease Nob1